MAHEAPGRGQRHGDFIYLSGEVGIGGAVMLDGTVLAGGHGWFGELGHVCVDPHGPACPCGSTGCLERYAGVEAILGRAGLAPDTRVEELVALAGEGAVLPAALGTALDEAAWALGVALASAVNILDVHTVVLGGHLGQLLETLRPRLQPTLDTRVLSARWVRPSVHAAPPDPAPGATGAAIDRLSLVLSDRPAGRPPPPSRPGEAARGRRVPRRSLVEVRRRAAPEPRDARWCEGAQRLSLETRRAEAPGVAGFRDARRRSLLNQRGRARWSRCEGAQRLSLETRRDELPGVAGFRDARWRSLLNQRARAAGRGAKARSA